MRTTIVIILLTSFLCSFSQEKVSVRGFYEIRYNMKDYESCISDTVEFVRSSLRESFRKKYIWNPWRKVKIRKYSICDLEECGERIILCETNDFSLIKNDTWNCMDYSFIIECFSRDCQSMMDSLSGESLKNKMKTVKMISPLFVKNPFSYKYSYRAYYIEGEALKYTYDNVQEFKKSYIYHQCISNLCEDKDSVEVYFLYNIKNIETVTIPDKYIWKRNDGN